MSDTSTENATTSEQIDVVMPVTTTEQTYAVTPVTTTEQTDVVTPATTTEQTDVVTPVTTTDGFTESEQVTSSSEYVKVAETQSSTVSSFAEQEYVPMERAGINAESTETSLVIDAESTAKPGESQMQTVGDNEEFIAYKKRDMSVRQRPRKIIVTRVSTNTTDDTFYQFFKQFGSIVRLNMPRDRTSNSHRNYAFITFESPDSAEKAAKQSGQLILGNRRLYIEYATNQDEETRSKKVYVGGVPRKITYDQFRDFFIQVGDLEDVLLMKDKNNEDENRGFGFVVFKNDESVDKVLTNSYQLSGKILDITPAIPKDDMPYAHSNQNIAGNINTNDFQRIFVSGITAAILEQDFENYFGQFGEIFDSKIMRHKETGESRGIGFVSFEDAETMKRVLNEKDHRICDVPIFVSRAKPRQLPGRRRDPRNMPDQHRQQNRGGRHKNRSHSPTKFGRAKGGQRRNSPSRRGRRGYPRSENNDLGYDRKERRSGGSPSYNDKRRRRGGPHSHDNQGPYGMQQGQVFSYPQHPQMMQSAQYQQMPPNYGLSSGGQVHVPVYQGGGQNVRQNGPYANYQAPGAQNVSYYNPPYQNYQQNQNTIPSGPYANSRPTGNVNQASQQPYQSGPYQSMSRYEQRPVYSNHGAGQQQNQKTYPPKR